MITSETPGSFARSVLDNRHPALITRVRDAFPYPPRRHRALDALLAEITEGVIEPLTPAAHDHEQWTAWGAAYFGRSWFEVPFLWAESYFYRKLLGAVGYFEPGPWQGIDPFGPFKRDELLGTAVTEELAALDEVAELPPHAHDRALLHGALWGNRADLGFRVGSASGSGSGSGAGSGDVAEGAAGSPGGVPEGVGKVLVDDGAALWERLGASSRNAVHVVADNAGRELIPDLVLIDRLLHTGRAAEAVLHVKPYPYYVSDATMADVIDCLRRVGRAPGRAGEIGARLWEAMRAGRLTVRAHPFSCAPLPYADMPADLRADFGRATLTVLKGDLNYRRLLGDRLWPPTASFAALTSYFPSPVLALRTLKSDVIAGLDAGTVSALEATGEAWRVSGTYAVIQGR